MANNDAQDFTLPPVSFTVERVGPMAIEKQVGETKRRFDFKFTPESAQATIDELQKQLDGKPAGSGLITVSFWGKSKAQ